LEKRYPTPNTFRLTISARLAGFSACVAGFAKLSPVLLGTAKVAATLSVACAGGALAVGAGVLAVGVVYAVRQYQKKIK
jgi:hypothetical protein